MKLRSNAHTHTIFCDGKNTVEEMVQAAIQREFVSLGFSMHGYTPYEPSPISYAREAEYRQEVRRVREKYRGQIEILLGVECDRLFKREYEGFEYYLDSTHWFIKDGEYVCVDYSEKRMLDWVRRLYGGDYYAYCRDYYRQCAQVCSQSSAQFIGHIDLVTKFNEGGKYFDETDPRYLGPAKEAIECAVQRGIPLEMNTGAISRGYRKTPYPAPHLLKYIRELGGEIIINSDAHSADGLETGFDACVALAVEAGFDHVLRLRAAGFEEVGLQ